MITGMAEISCPDLPALLQSWLLQLRLERKSAQTIRAYTIGVELFLAHSERLDKPSVIAWLATMTDNEPGTTRLRLAAVKQFAKWLAREDYLDADPILMIRPPKLDQKPVPGVTDEEIRRLLKVCGGKDWRSKRDKAMLLLLAETGMRAGELLALDVDDVDLAGCSLIVRKAKGGKSRRVRFSPSAAGTIDRYKRAVPGLHAGPLWRGTRGRLTYDGLRHTLGARADDAGVAGFHAHRMRHAAAIRWLDAGGTEGGLMAQSGWSSREMIDRYARASRETLAAKEFDRLGLQIDPD
jgi:integrase/recombinase XerD